MAKYDLVYYHKKKGFCRKVIFMLVEIKCLLKSYNKNFPSQIYPCIKLYNEIIY